MRILNEPFTFPATSFASNVVSNVQTLEHMAGYATWATYTVAASTAATFAAGSAGTAVIQDITYTDAVRRATSPVTIAYTTGGTAGSEVVTVVGSAVSIQIQSGTSTATQVKAVFDASAAATALASCSISGTAGTAQTAPVSATGIAGGTDSAVSVSANTITLANHGWATGRLFTLTSTGTLPAGLATSTNYYAIVVDANTIKVASSLANAQAGTAVTVSGQGTSGATHTATPTAFSGSMQLVASLDQTNWSNVGTTVTISATGTNFQNLVDVFYPWLQVQFNVSAGQLNAVAARVNAKGV